MGTSRPSGGCIGRNADVINRLYLQRLREITIFRSDEGSLGGWRRIPSGDFRMRRHLAALIITALSSLCLGARPVDAQEPSAAGLWQQIDPETSKSNGWFLISDHNGTFEGAIVKMFMKPGENPNPVCTKCPGDQQGMPWLGLTIIKGMERKGLEYEHGTILNPIDGNEWSALMRLSPDGQDLTVRGFLGIAFLGKDQYWKRLPDCSYSQLDPVVTTKFKLAAPKPGAPVAKGKPPAGC
jgi:uncharacterized protein (DUF2147 family)